MRVVIVVHCSIVINKVIIVLVIVVVVLVLVIEKMREIIVILILFQLIDSISSYSIKPSRLLSSRITSRYLFTVPKNYNDNDVINDSNTMKQYLCNDDDDDDDSNDSNNDSSNSNSNMKQYLISDDSNDSNDSSSNDRSKYVHKVIDVPKLENIKTTIMNSKRTQQSKEFCIRSGGYPDNDIKDDIYKYLLASASFQNDLTKASISVKQKLKKEECQQQQQQQQNQKEIMVTFGIL